MDPIRTIPAISGRQILLGGGGRRIEAHVLKRRRHEEFPFEEAGGIANEWQQAVVIIFHGTVMTIPWLKFQNEPEPEVWSLVALTW